MGVRGGSAPWIGGRMLYRGLDSMCWCSKDWRCPVLCPPNFCCPSNLDSLSLKHFQLIFNSVTTLFVK